MKIGLTAAEREGGGAGRLRRDLLLLDRVAADPPPWATAPLLAWDDQALRRGEPFLRQKYWTNRATINVFRVIGTQHPAYQGLTWAEFLACGPRMARNLALYAENSGYYTTESAKEPPMYYLTRDGGLSYYVAEDGNHRSAIARFDCWYRQDRLLRGVTVTDLRIDEELARACERLRALLQAGGPRLREARVEPVTRRVSREDGPGWMLERYAPALRARHGSREWELDAGQAMDLEQEWREALRRRGWRMGW